MTQGKDIVRTALILLIILTCISSDALAKKKKTFTTMGDVGQVLIPAAAAYMTYSKDDPEGTAQFLKSFAATWGTTFALKHITDTKRPDGGNYSFPSGHTSSAFAGAAFITNRYGWQYGFPAYVGAALVGVSRIDAHLHRPIDIVGSIVLAVGFNKLFTTPYKDSVKISYNVDGRNAQLSLNAKF